jgi:hypothetical protein
VHRPPATPLRLVGAHPGPDPLRPDPAAPSPFRLVHPGPARPRPGRRQRREQQAAAADIVAENHAAARLSTDDARAILASRVAEAIEGGRAAVLRPIARKNLVAVGAALGLRPFDTALVIAIVQDRARTGEAPAPPGADSRLALVPPAAHDPGARTRTIAVVLGVLLLAAAFFLALVCWITRP